MFHSFTSEDILGFILPNLQETKDFLINEHLILAELFSKQCSPWIVEVDILLEHFIKCNRYNFGRKIMFWGVNLVQIFL